MEFHLHPLTDTGAITSASRCVWVTERNAISGASPPSRKQRLWDHSVTLALFSLCVKDVEALVQKKPRYLFSLPAHLALFQDELRGHWG